MLTNYLDSINLQHLKEKFRYFLNVSNNNSNSSHENNDNGHSFDTPVLSDKKLDFALTTLLKDCAKYFDDNPNIINRSIISNTNDISSVSNNGEDNDSDNGASLTCEM